GGHAPRGDPGVFQRTDSAENGRMKNEIISVDDHVVEPPKVWTDRLPAARREAGPRVGRCSSRVTARTQDRWRGGPTCGTTRTCAGPSTPASWWRATATATSSSR